MYYIMTLLAVANKNRTCPTTASEVITPVGGMGDKQLTAVVDAAGLRASW